MSGIAGVIRFDGGPVAPGTVETMTSAMAHRGPDGIAHWHGDGIAMGHCMFRTTPESLEESQPLINEDASLVLVMDGRVDNWQDLRTELLNGGARLRTRADAELVLRAFERWDRDCLDRIHGDFALVLWDARARRAFCARDRTDMKPFFYHWAGTRLSFASELQPLLGLEWVAERVNELFVAEAITFSAETCDQTFWEDINRLVGAHWLVASADGIMTQRYWRPDRLPRIRYRRLDEYAEHYGALLTESVRRHSRSHRRIGTQVSGGLDSSAVFAIADRLQRNGRLAAPDFQGYTLRFDRRSPADEIDFARDVSRHVGRPVREIAPSLPPLDVYCKTLCQIRYGLYYPHGEMLMDIYRTAASDGARVMLEGIGGDEWAFGTPHYYHDLLKDGHAKLLWSTFRQDAKAFGTLKTLRAMLRWGLFPFAPVPLQKLVEAVRRQDRARSRQDEILSAALLSRLAARTTPEWIRMAGSRFARNGDAFYTLCSANRALGKDVENIATAHIQMEWRCPLDTAAMIEFSFRTPEYTRRLSYDHRLTHRRSIQGLLPDSVVNRESKANFSELYTQYLGMIDWDKCPALSGPADRWMAEGQPRAMIDAFRANPGGDQSGVSWEFCLWNFFVSVMTAQAGSPPDGTAARANGDSADLA